MAKAKKEKQQKVYVAGTKDRLFISKSEYDNNWWLVDRRGNVYENSPNPNDIIKHIDKFVARGTYELR